MVPSAATLTERRRVISTTIGGGKATVDVDSGELSRENGCNSSRENRVGVAGRNGPRPQPARQSSYKENIGHIAAETYLITRLAFTLLRCLGIGYLWITQLLALGCYAMLLMPGFLQVLLYYMLRSLLLPQKGWNGNSL